MSSITHGWSCCKRNLLMLSVIEKKNNNNLRLICQSSINYSDVDSKLLYYYYTKITLGFVEETRWALEKASRSLSEKIIMQIQIRFLIAIVRYCSWENFCWVKYVQQVDNHQAVHVEEQNQTANRDNSGEKQSSANSRTKPSHCYRATWIET